MIPTRFAGAMLALVVSVVLAIGALLLIAWGADRDFVSHVRHRRQLISLTLGVAILVLLAVYWISTPLFRGGCC